MIRDDHCSICGKFVGNDGFPVKHGKIEHWYHWRCYENEQREIRRLRKQKSESEVINNDD